MKTVRVLSGGAAAGVVRGMQERFQQDTGAGIEASFSAVGQMRDQLLGGAPCDLVILTQSLVEQLIASGHVVAGSARSLGLVRTGIAVKAGTPHPPIGDAASLAAALAGAPEVYLPDPEKSTGGIHFMKVLKALGLHETLRPALRPFPNGATAMAQMARSPQARAIGCTQETEILYTEGVELVGSLPQAFELATEYTLGLCTGAREPALALQLAELVAGPASESLRRQGGFTLA